MPELPDVTIYVERIAAAFLGQELVQLRIASPFVLRSVEPAPALLTDRALVGVERLGKRIVLGFAGELFAVLHLMIAGRLRLRPPGAAIPARLGLLAFDFPAGSLLFTEASKKKRASLHLVAGRAGLDEFRRGGVELLEADFAAFAAAMTRDNHTVKRALTDPQVCSGIGNAYSDEILHRARMSPFKRTRDMEPAELERLWRAARAVLEEWIERSRREVGDGFPDKVTAFREGMAVHGRYRQPCPDCGAPVQRIVYAENEANYCPGCQTGGVVLADRALSRLLKDNWPRTLEELEERLPAARRRR
jgi:formamidopyrimidine-DNA glycosylase